MEKHLVVRGGLEVSSVQVKASPASEGEDTQRFPHGAAREPADRGQDAPFQYGQGWDTTPVDVGFDEAQEGGTREGHAGEPGNPLHGANLREQLFRRA